MSAAPLDHADPRRIGRYRLLGRLGEGGQGVVYLGEDPAGTPVAVKVLKTTDATARARFAREMQSARQVAPFCTAAVLDSSADGPNPYVVSEFIDGPSLAQRVAERGPLRGGELQRLAVNTASALAAIHGAGIVHRDLKPANVLLGPDGPRVVDFGIARAIDAETHTQLVGTPSYFAPEWLEGRPPSQASDVFAWAGTIVYAATGRPPFGPADTVPAIMYRIANAEPDLTGVPPALAGLLAECLAKDPARRPTARDLMVRLVDPGAPAASAAPPPYTPTAPILPAAAKPAAPVRRRSLGTLIALAVIVALAVGFTMWPDGDDKPGSGGGGPASPPASSSTASVPAAGRQAGGGGTVPAAFAGTWKGTITQTGGVTVSGTSQTTATVTLPSGGTAGSVDYPSWGCSFGLQVVSVAGDAMQVRETGDTKAGTTGYCVGGAVTLTLRNGALDYHAGDGASGITNGTLRRS
ncbi:serine/threonine-protein kinase [Actinomadura macrotermitis]|uniref:Serine/threonine-protein kinase PknD n=1 Tax=Actinomadura macrotermitis TaxID=2585200 RepID=A0A7K0BPX2_9ACTN|nr:serine/threonine-protein kinase [Actinomadura macrotermitis]MQY03203.1 Serine/threonine-protein kinase PknD [Actinomadura macrotermitis]